MSLPPPWQALPLGFPLTHEFPEALREHWFN